MSDVFNIRIMSPVAVVWESEIESLTAKNSEGVFDILPDHARFVSLLHTSPVTVQLKDGSSKEFTFKNALLFFADNEAVIYVQENLEKV